MGKSAPFKKLRQKLLSAALASKAFRDELGIAAAEIRGEARKAANEATIAGVFDRIVYGLLKEIGFKFHPDKETAVDTVRHTGKGRTDSRVGAVVIEYKHHSKLRSDADVASAQEQLEAYIIAISEEAESEIVGFLTDGTCIFESRAVCGKISARSGKLSINDRSLLHFVRCIVLLEQAALTSKNLIRDFCGASYDGVLFHVARISNDILLNRSTSKTDMLRTEWEELFRLAHDDQSQQVRILERRAVLSEIFGERLNDAGAEYRALFALHTAYAIILKVIAYRVVSDIQFGMPSQDYRSLMSSDSQALRAFCTSLEDGEVFRHLGILNLLEGDFFSWYADENQWNSDLANAFRNTLEILSKYEEISNIFSSIEAVDLFRELYEATVPQVVRGSFGEFYTPFWLAEHVLETSKPEEGWRVLDPCCGSGTFVIAAISRIRKENKGLQKKALLKEVLQRVGAIDLNPVAVLTTRVHYFIHIADLLSGSEDRLIIPVYLGDSSYVPEKTVIANVECLKYHLRTLKTPISIELPVSLASDTARFVELMLKYEQLVKTQDSEGASRILINALQKRDAIEEIKKKIHELSEQLVALEKNGWNGIWARIITNFLSTACLERFTNIIGNPPWVDWKNLPTKYRERVKGLCIDKGLFSGAGRTGGINLNICALISHVAITNWLTDGGRLAFLMPRELALQPSYEGWRRSVGGERREFLEFHDWSRAGHPFDPVKEDFMTYLIGKKEGKAARYNMVPVHAYVKKAGCRSKAHRWENMGVAGGCLDRHEHVAGQIIPGSTTYSFAKDKNQLEKFAKITGECSYVGREGIEFYPQELLIFKYDSAGPKVGTAFFRNIQVAKSKYPIPSQRILLETKYLFPLVKGPAIGLFYHEYKGLVVPLPYKAGDPHRPIDSKTLGQKDESPLLLNYYLKYKETINCQTDFSDKIRGPNAGDFYGLARTGPYSFQRAYVGFRDNSKWRAVVVTEEEMPWGEKKRFVFQNHAVSMCERRNGGGYITEKEAHYICAILNSPVVEEFIYASSDNRSFKIRPPIFVPLYEETNLKHRELSRLSIELHKPDAQLRKLMARIEEIYLDICSEGKK